MNKDGKIADIRDCAAQAAEAIENMYVAFESGLIGRGLWEDGAVRKGQVGPLPNLRLRR